MKYCIINTEDNEITEKFAELGYFCIPVIPSDRVSAPISAHSDVLYKKINNNTIIVSGCQRGNIPELIRCGYKIIICDDLKPGYKTESLLNFIINEKYIVLNPATAISLPEEYITDKATVKVKQGYTKCSSLEVTDNAYITDDENIFNALTKNNIDCLKISKGEILLSGYDYGFIGGATVKLNDNEILFFGDIENKNEKNKIIEFLNKYSVKSIFIEGKQLKDIGSALIL